MSHNANSTFVQCFTVVSLILIASSANAQWLCRDSSSTRDGSTIMACGIGREPSLEAARNEAREQAIAEFNRLCSLSSDCRDYDYTVTPMRTDCDQEKNEYVCYRAIEFDINTTKRKEVFVNLDQIHDELNQKQQQVQALQNEIDQINELNEANELAKFKAAELEKLKDNLNKSEGEKIKLEQLSNSDEIGRNGYTYTHLLYKNSVKVAVSYWNPRFTSEKEVDLILDFSYEYRPVDWLGLQFGCGFGRDFSGGQIIADSDIPNTGPANSSQNYNGTMSITDINIAALLYSGYKGVYLKTEVGEASAQRKTNSVDFGPLGTSLSTTQQTESTSDSYGGLAIGFDSNADQKGIGYYTEIGGRYLFSETRLSIIGTAGLNFGF